MIVNDKYLKTLSSISIRVKPVEADYFKNASQKANMSMRQFIIRALYEKIDRDGSSDLPKKGD